jgi:hypothetical protein
MIIVLTQIYFVYLSAVQQYFSAIVPTDIDFSGTAGK